MEVAVNGLSVSLQGFRTLPASPVQHTLPSYNSRAYKLRPEARGPTRCQLKGETFASASVILKM